MAMKAQVDEVDTFEIEIEDMEAANNLAAADLAVENGEGQVDRADLQQTFHRSKSPKGQNRRSKTVSFGNLKPVMEEKKGEEL